MIKHCLMLVALILGIQAANAQTLVQGSLDVLRGEEYVKVVVDYSNALIMDMTEAEFAEYEEDWYKDQPIIMRDLLEEANDRLVGILSLGESEAPNYTLRWVVKRIDHDGYILSDFYLDSADGEVVAVITNVVGNGGMFGTKLYLIKTGAESTGRTLGKFLRKQLK